MTEKTIKKVPEKKVKEVNFLVDNIKDAKTLMIVSIKGLPSKQFQEIKKSIRKDAKVKVAKKNIMLRAIKGLKKESALPLDKYVNENCAFVISEKEGYELAGILSKKKSKVFAKAGQTAPNDIEISKGPTDLVPGPAISELGSVGLQVAVENGKLSIRASKVVVKQGGTIGETLASILQKLHIQPFSVGLEPVAIYDLAEEKIYDDIKIDSNVAAAELSLAAGKALGFAQKIAYACRETIGSLLAIANSHANALSKLSGSEAKAEEAPVEEVKTE